MDTADYASKDALCRPGTYSPLPHELRSRRDLSAIEKLICSELLDRMRGRQTWVAASAGDLARGIGSGRTAVHAGLARLESIQVLRGRRRRGQPTLWAFVLTAEGAEKTPRNTGNTCSQGEQVPVRDTGNTCSRGEQPPVRDTGRSCPQGEQVSYKTLHLTHTHTARAREETTEGKQQQPQHSRQESFVPAWLVGQISEAYRSVHGCPMPASWHRRIEEECKVGNAELLGEIDDAAIRGGRQVAQEAGHIFGLGHTLRALADRKASVLAKNAQQRRRAQQQAAEASDKNREVISEIWRAKRAHFDSLPEARQEQFVRDAARQSRVQRPDAVAAWAMQLAWLQKESNACSAGS